MWNEITYWGRGKDFLCLEESDIIKLTCMLIIRDAIFGELMGQSFSFLGDCFKS